MHPLSPGLWVVVVGTLAVGVAPVERTPNDPFTDGLGWDSFGAAKVL
jgi:acyl carrier protein